MAISQFPSKGLIPAGSTAARPTGAALGDTYYNGTLTQLEIWDGNNWVACSAPPGVPTVSSRTDIGTARAVNNGAVSVAFAADPNSPAPTSYQVNATVGGAFNTGATSPIIVSGLTSNTSYQFTVTAYNKFGASAASTASTAITATTVPGAPTSVSASADAGGVFTITWSAPANTGGKTITGYTVNAYDGASFTTSTTTSSTSTTLSGLSSGTAYTFKALATNANGDGLESTASDAVTWNAVTSLSYVVLGAGASGGGNWGGGGGGGWYTSGTFNSISASNNTNYTVTIGAGGASTQWDNGADGSTSTFYNINAQGGSGGGREWTGGRGGLQGGGGGAGRSGGGGGSSNVGGNGGNSNTGNTAAGGGGTSGSGEAAQTNRGGNGGAGLTTNISGTAVGVGGGGGGMAGYNVTGPGGNASQGGGAGGDSGAFQGQQNGIQTGGTGGVNTGGGGGGGGNGAASGAGGSGWVVLTMPSTSPTNISVGAGLTYTSQTTGGNKIYSFTAGTGNVKVIA